MRITDRSRRRVTVGVVRWACDGRTFTLGHLSHTLIPAFDHLTEGRVRKTWIEIEVSHPLPSVNSNGLLRSRDESNFLPLVNVPTRNHKDKHYDTMPYLPV